MMKDKNVSKLKIFITIGILAISIKANCSNFDNLQNKFHFGLIGGFSQSSSLSGDFLGGLIFPLDSNKIELNIGYSYFKNKTNFDNVKDLWYYSHGVFSDFNFFFVSNIYIGARLSANMNFVDKESQNMYDEISPKKPPTYFTGIASYAQIGFIQPIGKRINFRLQGQIGIQNYRIATGALYFSNSSSPIPDSIKDRYAEEQQSKFLYNLSLGLMIKL